VGVGDGEEILIIEGQMQKLLISEGNLYNSGSKIYKVEPRSLNLVRGRNKTRGPILLMAKHKGIWPVHKIITTLDPHMLLRRPMLRYHHLRTNRAVMVGIGIWSRRTTYLSLELTWTIFRPCLGGWLEKLCMMFGKR
jgi:hypothetical protein